MFFLACSVKIFFVSCAYLKCNVKKSYIMMFMCEFLLPKFLTLKIIVQVKSHSSGKVFDKILDHCCADLPILPPEHQRGHALTARCQHSNSSQKCSVGLRSWLCAGHSSSTTPTLANYVFMALHLCKGTL